MAEKNTSLKKILISVAAVFCVIFISAVLISCIAAPDDAGDTQTPPLSQNPTDGAPGETTASTDGAGAELTETDPVPETEPTVAPTECTFIGFGTCESAAELGWLLDAASDLLNGQDTLFTTETPVLEGTLINYYLDDTLFAVCWQQVMDNMIYTISEVKIAEPTQFRRYLSENSVKSKALFTTTQLSEQAGAVIAGSGDYFQSREAGIVVYDGVCVRCYGAKQLDTCFVDINGDLILAPKGTFEGTKAVQQFVDENNISFSFAFGPILVSDGVRCEPSNYGLGEPKGHYARAAICQRDDLHYLMVVANGNKSYQNYPDIHVFAENIEALGCEKAYALDGGQTGTIAYNHQAMNPTQYADGQRRITDIFCFYSGFNLPVEEPEETNPTEVTEVTEVMDSAEATE